MKLFFVYILKCSDDTYYTGITNDPERRLAEHQSGLNQESYTYSRRPVKQVYLSDGFSDPLEAIGWEKQLKDWNRKKKEAVINGKWELLPELSKNRKGTEK
jgi:putative endonuclease